MFCFQEPCLPTDSEPAFALVIATGQRFISPPNSFVEDLIPNVEEGLKG